MVLPKAVDLKPEEIALNGHFVELTDIAPELGMEHITVRINDREAEVISLQKVVEIGKEKGGHFGMVAYLVEVKRNVMPVNGKITVSLEYDAVIELDGQPVRVNSKGYTQFYYNFKGLSKC